MTSITAIITAGGSGQRMGSSTPKQFLDLAGIPVIIHTIKAFAQCSAIEQIVLVVPSPHIPYTEKIIQEHSLQSCCRIVAGGVLRQDSVKAGMKAASETDYLIVHDGVRPLVDGATIDRCLAGAVEHGAAITAIPVKDTLKSVADNGLIRQTVDRSGLWQAQTPQAVRHDILEKAYQAAHHENFIGTDEASLIENMGYKVAVVPGSERNLKITHPEDLQVAEALLQEDVMTKQQQQSRIGHGYDAHRLVSDLPLVLGGVTIPHSTGLLGHSDADVLCHALCDALLGAIGAGDIGKHFPDSDPAYKGIASTKLLAQVMESVKQKGYKIGNADITVMAQQPKLAPHLAAMKSKLAAVCETTASTINIKATTTEEMGFTGRQEGIACHAVVIINCN